MPTVNTARYDEPSFVVVGGPDVTAVKELSKQVIRQWQLSWPDAEVEVFDAEQDRVDACKTAFTQIVAALKTPSLFAKRRILWLRGGESLSSTGKAALQKEWQFFLSTIEEGLPEGIKVLVSAYQPDRQSNLWKCLTKLGKELPALGIDPQARDWEARALSYVSSLFTEWGQRIEEEAALMLVQFCGPDTALLRQEAEKVSIYAGEAVLITRTMVEEVAVKSHYARAFALADAIGERDLSAAVHALEEELWLAQFDSQRSVIGVLYGLIHRIRMLLLVRALCERGLLQASLKPSEIADQLAALPKDLLPADRRWNPSLVHPFAVWKACQQARNYTVEELIGAIEVLFEANVRLVTSDEDPHTILRAALLRIIGRTG